MEDTLSKVESFLRSSLSEEQEAVSVYVERKRKCEEYAAELREEGNEEDAKKCDIVAYTIGDILGEEEVHIGQLRKMLEVIGVDPANERKGEEEGSEDIQKLSGELDDESIVDDEVVDELTTQISDFDKLFN